MDMNHILLTFFGAVIFLCFGYMIYKQQHDSTVSDDQYDGSYYDDESDIYS